MIITKMTATFGCLDGAEITFHEGLNIIQAPNEFGKSTWSAFLLAMLYGVDTSQRSTKTGLAVKDKYRPWNGKPMAGQIDLIFQGQPITLQRTTKGKVPMGEFRGFYKDSGIPVPHMTGETCGQILLGVGQGVYRRSGFLGQQALPISPDDSLEAGLMALVTQGDEEVSYSQTQKALGDLRNRRRHNRTGLLPQAESQREEIRETMEKLHSIAHGNQEILGEIQEKQEQLRKIHQWDTQAKQAQVSQAKAQWEAARADSLAMAQDVKHLPTTAQAQEWLLEIAQLSAQQELLEQEVKLTVEPMPQKPQGFGQKLPPLPPEPKKRGSTLLFFLALLSMIALAVPFLGVDFSPWIGGSALIATAVAWTLRNRRFRIQQHTYTQKKEAYLAQYGVISPEGLQLVTQSYERAMAQYEVSLARATAQKERLSAQQERQDSQVAELLCQLGKWQTLAEGKAYLRQILACHDHATQARQVEAQEKATYDALILALGAPEEGVELGDYQWEDMERCRRELAQLEGQLQHRYGQMSALGELGILEAQELDLTEKIAKYQREYDGLTLAMAALEQANRQLQKRLSPQVGAMAGDYLNHLTSGVYDRVHVGQAMALEAKLAGEISFRSPLHLSGGTADQLYLAVRLAIANLVLTKEAPLVLDDALAFFDDDRMRNAVKLLENLGETRQIILFTCHSREKT